MWWRLGSGCACVKEWLETGYNETPRNVTFCVHHSQIVVRAEHNVLSFQFVVLHFNFCWWLGGGCLCFRWFGMVCIMRIATAHVDVLCFHTGTHGRGVCQGSRERTSAQLIARWLEWVLRAYESQAQCISRSCYLSHVIGNWGYLLFNRHTWPPISR